MPIYEYTCQKCGAELELLVSNSRARPACEQCGSKQLERRLSTFSAHGGAAPSCAEDACPTCPSGGCPYAGG